MTEPKFNNKMDEFVYGLADVRPKAQLGHFDLCGLWQALVAFAPAEQDAVEGARMAIVTVFHTWVVEVDYFYEPALAAEVWAEEIAEHAADTCCGGLTY